jgi:hypothetical protein
MNVVIRRGGGDESRKREWKRDEGEGRKGNEERKGKERRGREKRRGRGEEGKTIAES